MDKLRIDPDFRDKIPPLTEAEYEQLRDNILADGEVYEPIITWNDTIVDGHNRWKIICENWELLKNKYRVKELEFSDKWEAIDWMCKKQLGRRNLSDEQRTALIGKMAIARSKSHGGDRRSEKFSSGQNGALKSSERTRDIIARELGVGTRTVDRAIRFAKGIDALREESPEAADKVLAGGSGATKQSISDLPEKSAEEIRETAQEILSGEIKKPKNPNAKGWTKADKESRAETDAIIADMYDPTSAPEFTIEFLLEDIDANGMEYVSLLRNTLIDRSTLLTEENRPAIADAIERIINEIKKVKELVKQ